MQLGNNFELLVVSMILRRSLKGGIGAKVKLCSSVGCTNIAHKGGVCRRQACSGGGCRTNQSVNGKKAAKRKRTGRDSDEESDDDELAPVRKVLAKDAVARVWAKKRKKTASTRFPRGCKSRPISYAYEDDSSDSDISEE